MGDLCKIKLKKNEFVRGQDYVRPPTFCTPLCGPYEEKLFYTAEQPNKPEVSEMCPYNNDCQNNENYTYLNERGVKASPFFEKGKSNLGLPVQKTTKLDARLVDVARNYHQELDIKPIQVYYDLIHDNVSHDPNLRNYGKNYTSYSNVTGGQIQYYINKQQSDPFYRPIYAATTPAVGYTWKDPMDAVKPQFEKEYPQHSFTGLSWLDDSCAQRDDITALQQRKHHEQNFQMVYNRI